MPTDIVQRFYMALPRVKQWIDDYIQQHASEARAVKAVNIERLSQYYSDDLLACTNVVTVRSVEFPPVHIFGVPEFADLQQMAFDGITFKDTYFIRRGYESPALHFHELVHVVQWRRLGVENFLLAYAVGLLQNEYRQTPLEVMAYSLQSDFERRRAIPRLIQTIEEETDAIWHRAAPLF
jgi:hypothetical protein